MQLLHRSTNGRYDIVVYDTPELEGEKGAFRVLQFSGDAMQGALDLNRPDRIVFEYQRAIHHLMAHNAPSFDSAFVIGHGIGTLARQWPDRRLKIAELSETVVDLSRRYFGYEGDNVVVGDGRLILADEAPGSYDYIVVDAFSDRGTPLHLTSREFFRLAADKLNGEGAIILNLIGRGTRDALIGAIHTTLAGIFPCTGAFVLPDRRRMLVNMLLVGAGKPVRFQSRRMAGFAAFRPEGRYELRDRGGER